MWEHFIRTRYIRIFFSQIQNAIQKFQGWTRKISPICSELLDLDIPSPPSFKSKLKKIRVGKKRFHDRSSKLLQPLSKQGYTVWNQSLGPMGEPRGKNGVAITETTKSFPAWASNCRRIKSRIHLSRSDECNSGEDKETDGSVNTRYTKMKRIHRWLRQIAKWSNRSKILTHHFEF